MTNNDLSTFPAEFWRLKKRIPQTESLLECMQVIWSCHRSDIIGVKILGDSGAGPNLGIQASLRCHLFSCLGRLEHQTTKQRDISGVVWDRCTSLSVNVSKV